VGLGACDHGVGDGAVGAVGVRVDGECAVVTIDASGVVEEEVDVLGFGLIGFVGDLRGGLVDVDEGAIELGKAHRHA
jgi:hypothetical protein